MATTTGAGTLANGLLSTLLDSEGVTIPAPDITGSLYTVPTETGDLYATVTALTPEDLTEGVVNGSGMFDKLMASLVAHLKVEYDASRISGAEYSKAYVGLVTAAMQSGTQYLLGRDAAYWQALLVQKQAQMTAIEVVTARVKLDTARVELARAQYEARTAEAAYGLTKIKISVEDITYGNLEKTGAMIDEQMEAQRAQTMDTRSDGTTTIAGSMGKQKDLYSQQIVSYQRSDETKFVKIFSDAWITQKTIDEGLTAPDQFTNTSVDSILEKLRTNLSLEAIA